MPKSPLSFFSGFFTITGAGFMQGKENGNAKRLTHPVVAVYQWGIRPAESPVVRVDGCILPRAREAKMPAKQRTEKMLKATFRLLIKAGYISTVISTLPMKRLKRRVTIPMLRIIPNCRIVAEDPDAWP